MKCNQAGCEQEAKYSYVWPGRAERQYACARHVQLAQRISEAVGFHLGDIREEVANPGKEEAHE